MWTSAVTAFLYFYNLIQTTLNTISGGAVTGGAGSLLAKFFGLLNCIGFTDAYSATSPAINASLIFLLSSILYKVTIVSYGYYIRNIQPLIN